MKNKRNRTAEFMQIAMNIARENGLHAVTTSGIARKASVTHSLISYHLGPIDSVRDAVAKRAVEINDATIVAYLIATNHRVVKDIRR